MSQSSTQTPHQEEIALLKSVMAGWNHVQNERIEFCRLTGLTNITYRIKDRMGKIPSVVFKKFSVVEGLIQKQHENRIIIQGSMKGIVPSCYFTNEKYRIEEDLVGSTHPSNQELQDINLIRKIIVKMVGFHKIELEAIRNLPLFADYILSSEFVNRAKAVIATKTFNQAQRQVLNKILPYFDEGKLLELRDRLIPSKKSPVRLCHNDLNNLNILQKAGKVYLIDCEYARYNYLAYDIANFLSESCIYYEKESFPYFEFKDQYLPTKDRIKQVCELYLHEAKTQKVDYSMIESLARDVEKCFGLCNFYWAVWSPISKNDNISFGYMEHARKRLQRFEATLSGLSQGGS